MGIMDFVQIFIVIFYPNIPTWSAVFSYAILEEHFQPIGKENWTIYEGK